MTNEVTVLSLSTDVSRRLCLINNNQVGSEMKYYLITTKDLLFTCFVLYCVRGRQGEPCTSRAFAYLGKGFRGQSEGWVGHSLLPRFGSLVVEI